MFWVIPKNGSDKGKKRADARHVGPMSINELALCLLK